jgi:hypothetical protein
VRCFFETVFYISLDKFRQNTQIFYRNAIYKIQIILYIQLMIDVSAFHKEHEDRVYEESRPWIDDPKYLFIYQGFKSMCAGLEPDYHREQWYNRQRKIEMLIAWNFIGVVYEFLGNDFFDFDEKTNTIDYDEVDEYDSTRFKDKLIERHGYDIDRDRTIWIDDASSELMLISTLVANGIKGTNKDSYFQNGFSDESLRRIKDNNLNLETMKSFYESYIAHFDTLKVGYWNEYLSGENINYKYDPERDDIRDMVVLDPSYSLKILFSKDLRMLETPDPNKSLYNDLGSSYDLAIKEIKKITCEQGIKVKLTRGFFRIDWKFKGQYQGQTVTGKVSQEDHFLQFVEGKEYYAFLNHYNVGTRVVYELNYLIAV